jgi:hypothetical protein
MVEFFELGKQGMLFEDWRSWSSPRMTVEFVCPAPEQPGSYMLKFDLVAEGVTWFETTGSPAAATRLTVIAR